MQTNIVHENIPRRETEIHGANRKYGVTLQRCILPRVKPGMNCDERVLEVAPYVRKDSTIRGKVANDNF